MFVGKGGELVDGGANGGDNGDTNLSRSARYDNDSVGMADDAKGFFGELGALDLISITDIKGTHGVPADDIKYLGVVGSGIGAELVGVDSVVLRVWDGAFKYNRVTPDKDPVGSQTPRKKMDWKSLDADLDPAKSVNIFDSILFHDTDGIEEALDLKVQGKAALNIAEGVVVAVRPGWPRRRLRRHARRTWAPPSPGGATRAL